MIQLVIGMGEVEGQMADGKMIFMILLMDDLINYFNTEMFE